MFKLAVLIHYLYISTHKIFCISYPVCLSPMINSLCPLPIGTKLSTALIPVCIGSFTEIRGMIPGAFTPTRARPSVLTGP